MTIGDVKTISKIEAERFASNATHLLNHMKLKGKVPSDLMGWIRQLSGTHQKQLSDIGLIGEYVEDLTVQELIDLFLEHYELRDGISASSVTQFRSAMKNRIPKFLKSKKISQIEPKQKSHRANAEPVFSTSTISLMTKVHSWQREHYAKSSWSRGNGRLREVGYWAEKQGLVDYNPFTLLPSPGERNPLRNEYVPRDVIEDVIDFCPDFDTRLVFVFGRYAGLRLPSEIRTIKWRDIDMENNTLSILDSKTKEYRVMPLFKRLRQELDIHPNKTGKWLMSSSFLSSLDADNWRKLTRAIDKSPHERWEKVRQNLRTSCENDLLSQFKPHLVYEWIGHTERVSKKHYQKATPHDISNALEIDDLAEYGV